MMRKIAIALAAAAIAALVIVGKAYY